MRRQYKNSGTEWIEMIPETWEVNRFKNKFKTGKGLNITKGDLVPKGIPVVSYGQIHSKKNTGTHLDDLLIRYIPSELAKDGLSSKVSIGDFIFADTSEDIDGCGNAVYVDKEIGLFAGYHSVIAFAKNPKESKFLAYLFLTECWRSQIRMRVTGIKVFSISQAILNETTIILPPVNEQLRIADYLDEKCGEINSLIELQEQMIEKLKTYKRIVITEAVTKGLNPNVQLVPSGIDWIGDIPEGWEVAKAKYFVVINNGSDPQLEGDIPVYGSGATSFKTCGEYKEGPTVLLGRKGATLHIPHYIDGKYWNVDTAFDVRSKGKMALRYYYFLAICFDYKYYISQTTLPGMAQSSYYNMKIPVPSVSEQQVIANYLDGKCSEIDELIDVKQLKIEKLKDYKNSLIYECVTGKREIA